MLHYSKDIQDSILDIRDVSKAFHVIKKNGISAADQNFFQNFSNPNINFVFLGSWQDRLLKSCTGRLKFGSAHFYFCLHNQRLIQSDL